MASSKAPDVGMRLFIHLKEIGFLQLVGDPCVYIAAWGVMVVIGVYVDDIVVACKSDEQLKQIKRRSLWKVCS